MKFQQLLPRIVIHNYPHIKRIEFEFKDAEDFYYQPALEYHTKGTELTHFEIDGLIVYLFVKNGTVYTFGQLDNIPIPEMMCIKPEREVQDGFVFRIGPDVKEKKKEYEEA